MGHLDLAADHGPRRQLPPARPLRLGEGRLDGLRDLPAAARRPRLHGRQLERRSFARRLRAAVASQSDGLHAARRRRRNVLWDGGGNAMTSRGRSREELLQDLADGDLAAIGHDTQDRERAIQISGLDPETFQLAEIIALVAMDAQPASWYLHLGGPDANLDLEKIVGALIAVAPIVGSSRVISAAANIVGARDFVDELDDETT